MPHTDIDKRLMDLEIKASFTEDLVEQLNQTIFQQQQQIDALIREVSQPRQQTPDGGSGGFTSLSFVCTVAKNPVEGIFNG